MKEQNVKGCCPDQRSRRKFSFGLCADSFLELSQTQSSDESGEQLFCFLASCLSLSALRRIERSHRAIRSTIVSNFC